MEYSLPENWELINLVEDLNFQPTGVLKYEGLKKYFSTGSIQDSNYIPEGEFNFENRPSRANREVKLNDVLQARMKNTDKGILINKKLDGQLFSTGFIQLRSYAETYNSKLLYYLIKSDFFLNQKNDYATGSTQEALTDDGAKKIVIPLPPLPEQHRIVAKLDALFEKIESNKQRLEKIPKILKRFRQSVLSAAVNGKLTEEWREKNGIVEEWKEVDLSSVLPKGGIFDGPFGSNLKTDDYKDKGIRVIRLENIGHLRFIHEKETFINKEKYQTLIKHTVGEGDIIFSSFISEEIRTCILPKLSTKAIAKADCFCIRPDATKIDKLFLLYTLISIRSYEQLVMNIHGATRPRINTTQLKTLQIFLPKLEEQKEIVRRVEQLFAFADKIEARYTKAKAMLDKLPQSILAKAFRGELVAQDPNDEPASVLLERIKAEKEKLAAEKKLIRQAQGKGKKTKEYSIEEKSVKIAAEKKINYKNKKK